MGKLRNLWTTYKYNGVKGVVRKLQYKTKDMYSTFIAMEDILTAEQMNERMSEFSYLPIFSIIIPIYQPKMVELDACLESILSQGYDRLELCLVDDGSQDPDVINYLKKMMDIDKRLKVQINTINQGISVASNDAIALATGEYIGLVDQDDMLAPNALYEYAAALQSKKYDFLYSDEDMINEKNQRFNPQFKPNWSPHTLLSRMYVNHFSVYRAEIVRNVGGFRTAFNGSQDYDLLLRASLHFEDVFHSSKLLYHWRTSENSIAASIDNKSYIYDKATRAIEDFLKQQNVMATATSHNDLLIYDLAVEVQGNPLVSIIVPFKNGLELTQKLLDSIIEYGGYKNIEVILINNQSTAEQKRGYSDFLEGILERKLFPIKMIDADFSFNYSKINNLGVEHSNGEYLLFLNNDIEFIEDKTIYQLLSVAQLPKTGAVGMTLLYPDKTIQHAGVIMGYHEVAGHSGVGMTYDNTGYYGRNVSLYNFSAVTAACLMVKKEYFNEVHGFEEKLSVAYNDVDFCLKLLEKGYFNVNNGSIQAKHHESITRGKDSLKDERYLEECNYMKRKWRKYIEKDPFYSRNLSIHVGELYQLNLEKDG